MHKLKKIPQHLWLTLSIALVLAVTMSGLRFGTSSNLVFSVNIAATTDMETPIFQLFYDVGRHFNERDSRSVQLPQDRQAVPVSIPIPGRSILGLRVDLLNGPGTVVMQGLRVTTRLGKTLYTPDKNSEVELHQIETMEVKPEHIRVTINSEANDPYLVLYFSPPLRSAIKGDWSAHLSFGLKLFIVLFCGLELLLLLAGDKNRCQAEGGKGKISH